LSVKCDGNTGYAMETPSTTYLKGLIFLAPALVFWLVVSTKCFPVVTTIWQNSHPTGASAGQSFLSFSTFLVQYGFAILGAVLALLVSFELFSGAWPRYRRRAVDVAVWLTNFAVIAGVAALLTFSLIEFPRLLK
jgi:hypothetical protein